MTENGDPRTVEQQLQDMYRDAFPSQDLLSEIDENALPSDYRQNIRIKMTRNDLLIAFSEQAEFLEPNEEGFIPKSKIKLIPALTRPNKVGATIKDWIDSIKNDEKLDSD
jgi:hypothetical protein